MDDSAEYKLVWNDEFELDHLDLRKWSSNGSGCWSGDYKFCLTGELWRFENSVGTLIMKNFDKPDGKARNPLRRVGKRCFPIFQAFGNV